jgi:CubicO group peptidase (beta-lactamase class C family)
MIRWLVVIGSLLCFFLLCFSSQGKRVSQLRSEIEKRVKLKYNQAIAVAHIDRKGVKFLCAGKAKEETLFEIGSMTKIFTAHLTLLLEREGYLSIDCPIKHYLPASFPLSKEIKERVTLRHLLTHTSTLQDPAEENYYNRENQNTVPLADFSFEDFRSYLQQARLSGEPGSQIRYSNLGYALVGYILEQSTDKEYATLLTEKILRPLGMDHTYCEIPQASLKDLVQGYRNGVRVPLWNVNIFPAYAGVKSTIKDIAQYLHFWFFEKKEEEDRRLLERLLDPYLTWRQEKITATVSWTIDERFDGRLYAMTGKTLGCSSFMGYDPRLNEGLVILTDADELDSIGFHFFNHRFFQSTLYQSASLPLSELEKWNGSYVVFDTVIEVKARTDCLELHSPGELPLRCYPLGGGRFFTRTFYRGVQSVRFEVDAQGEKKLFFEKEIEK